MESHITITIAVFLILYVVAVEGLDWIGRAEAIKRRWPKAWAVMTDRPGRVVLILIAIGLLAKVVFQRLPDAIPVIIDRKELKQETSREAPKAAPLTKKQEEQFLYGNASTEPSARAAVTVSVRDSNGLSLRGAQLLLVSPNGTHTPIAFTDATGSVRLPKPASGLVDVYCAHNDFLAYHKSEYDPTKPLQITLAQQPGVGSLIQAGEGYIQIPGLDGGLDPRTYPSTYPNAGEHYVYFKNLSVNGHVESLFPFTTGQVLILEDNNGHHVDLELVAANAECFLMQYKKS